MEIGIDYENDDNGVIPMTVEAVPMAFAIPLDLDSPSKSTPIIKVDTTAAFMLGQQVRLVGLADYEMNELLAEVKERMPDRIILHIPNHDSFYSVRPENLIMVK
jgi:hypothetical protein